MTILAGKKMVSTSHMDNSLSLFVNSALCKNFILLLLAFFLNVINDWVSLPEHTSAVGESNTSLLESTPRTCIGGTGPCYGEKVSPDAHFVFRVGFDIIHTTPSTVVKRRGLCKHSVCMFLSYFTQCVYGLMIHEGTKCLAFSYISTSINKSKHWRGFVGSVAAYPPGIVLEFNLMGVGWYLYSVSLA